MAEQEAIERIEEVPPPEDQSEYVVDELEPAIELRDIPKSQAKQEVNDLIFSSSIHLRYGEIADELRLDLRLVVEVCHELAADGVIELE